MTHLFSSMSPDLLWMMADKWDVFSFQRMKEGEEERGRGRVGVGMGVEGCERVWPAFIFHREERHERSLNMSDFSACREFSVTSGRSTSDPLVFSDFNFVLVPAQIGGSGLICTHMTRFPADIAHLRSLQLATILHPSLIEWRIDENQVQSW